METAVTEAFIKTIRGLGKKYMEDVEGEAVKFALLMKTLYPPTVLSVASAQHTHHPVATEDALQHRVNMLESIVDRLIQEVGDMDNRVTYTEQMQADDGWHGAAGEPLSTNEFVDIGCVDEPVRVVKTGQVAVAAVVPEPVVVAPAPALEPVVVAPAPEPEPEPVVVAPVPVPEPVAIVPAPAPAPAPAAESSPEINEEGDGEEQEQEEEEEPEAALEEFEFDGKTFYRDEENNVYTVDDDGDLDPDAVGRWLVKSQKIKFFTKA